jgi:hypothetical protein
VNSGRLRGLFHVKRRLPGCPPDRAGVSRETPPSAWHRSRRYREGCERLPEPDCGPRERSTRAVGDTRPPSWGPTAPNGPHRAPVLRGRRPGRRRRGGSRHGLPGSAQLGRSTGRVRRTAPGNAFSHDVFHSLPTSLGVSAKRRKHLLPRTLHEYYPKLARKRSSSVGRPINGYPRRCPHAPGSRSGRENKAAGKGCAGPAVA